MQKKVDNQNTFKNPVGRFMVAAGAIVELNDTGRILIQKRSVSQEWQPNEWEIPYGRLAQFEDVYTGLKRELNEETGITDAEILKPIRIWHMFRGFGIKAENELIGITFHCRTKQEKIVCSSEHSTFRWATPEEALKLIKVEGIRKDIEAFIKK